MTAPPAQHIDIDQTGEPLRASSAVFTGTTAAGLASGTDCDAWTATTDAAQATVGFTDWGDFPEAWTAFETPLPCNVTARLYCFEQ